MVELPVECIFCFGSGRVAQSILAIQHGLRNERDRFPMVANLAWQSLLHRLWKHRARLGCTRLWNFILLSMQRHSSVRSTQPTRLPLCCVLWRLVDDPSTVARYFFSHTHSHRSLSLSLSSFDCERAVALAHIFRLCVASAWTTGPTDKYYS